MRKKIRKAGFTMAEMLIVIAIVAVLAGLSFVAIISYQRTLTKTEYDGYAREIFISAQNHLAMAKSQNYLGRTENLTTEEQIEATLGKSVGGDVYYFVVENKADTIDAKLASAGSLLGLMLPTASVDETVRLGGSYLVRYQKNTGRILDVYYWSETNGRYKYEYIEPDSYGVLTSADKSDLKNLNGSVIGYYGGEQALKELGQASLYDPAITIKNAETLSVTVQDPNYDKYVTGTSNPIAKLKIIITGKQSKVEKVLEITQSATGTKDKVTLDGNDTDITFKTVQMNVKNESGTVKEKDAKEYTIVLDNVTKSGEHFYDLFCNGDNLNNNMIPGEDITIQAKSVSTTHLANIGSSSKRSTNSLFASIGGNRVETSVDYTNATARISNFRHLENLSQDVSQIKGADAAPRLKTASNQREDVIIKSAVQIADLTNTKSWNGFVAAIKTMEKERTGADTEPASIKVNTIKSSLETNDDSFLPVNMPQGMTYNGQNHSISDVKINNSEDVLNSNAGLFGTLLSGTVENLKMVDFEVTGVNAGALAGKIQGATVRNVVAINSIERGDGKNPKISVTINGTGNAGGLIGLAEALENDPSKTSEVEKSAAALFVQSNGNAGGLIGSMPSGSIRACYSGGHTGLGSYLNVKISNVYQPNVSGNVAGGLVGNAGATAVKYSYSTCSVQGDSNAGGLVGTTGADSQFTNCYVTGLITGTRTDVSNPDNPTARGAFAGVEAVTASNCYYFEIINEEKAADGTITYLTPLVKGQDTTGTNEQILPLDQMGTTYYITGDADADGKKDWQGAVAYDPTLVANYQGKYDLQSVRQLSQQSTDEDEQKLVGADDFAATHYGDWPMPETFVQNQKN